MIEKTIKPELRDQTESQSDGFSDATCAKARPKNSAAQTNIPQAENPVDENSIRERAHQLYEESDRQEGNADEHWHQAECELKRRRA
jgi:hypothetical protein